MKKKVLLLPGAYNSPAARFRIWQLAEPLKKAGYDITIRVPFPDRENKGRNGKEVNLPTRVISLLRIVTAWWITRDAHKFSAVITNRDIISAVRISFLEKRIVSKGGRLIFDFDDAIHLGARNKKLRDFLPDCAYVVGGNPMLRDYGLSLNPRTVLIPTVVNTSYYKPNDQLANSIIRIGWSGSASTNKHCLPLLKDPIVALAKKMDFQFVVISNEDPCLNWEGVQYEFISWRADNEVEQLQTFDLGLMPLNDTEFERGKCGLKAIQYMAVGIPALVSPVGVNAEIVEHGVCGFHCSSVDDWEKYILKLYSDKSLRIEMGKKARQHVEACYSVDYAITLWKNLLNSI